MLVFLMCYPVVPAMFAEKTFLSLTELSWHLCENQLVLYMWLYFQNHFQVYS